MRVHVVSDVHGAAGPLRHAAVGADALLCLGDLLLFVDYADHGQGIFADLFGAEAARQFVALRTAKRFDEARALSAGLWRQLGGDPAQHIRDAASRQYAELFAALPQPAYLTYGNVDIPKLWGEHLRPAHHVLDGERMELGGWTFGFVGGGLHSPYRTPNEIDDDAYAAKVAAVGAVDVLCSHIPPAVPQLLYDTVARRMERGSEALLGQVSQTQPRYVLFGHVHQPLARRVRIGRTECINVGHFRATGEPYVLEWYRYAPSMADRTTSSITVAVPRVDVMAVIADFAAYPEWASAVRSAEVVGRGGDGRASRVRFGLDAGVVKDSYVLSYDWDGDAGVRWDLAEPGSVITALSGGYVLADADGGTEVTYDLAVNIRIPMPGMLKRRAERTIIDTALKGLRDRAETGRGDRT